MKTLSEFEERINVQIVNDTLDDITQTIFKTTKTPIEQPIFDDQRYDAAIKTVKNYNLLQKPINPKYKLIIGTKNLHEHNVNNQVPIQDFVYLTLCCFHEERHLEQLHLFQQPTCTAEVRHMAHIHMLQDAIKETYSIYEGRGYWHNINEIDAELYGIQKTKLFFEHNFPEIDVDKHLVHIIQKEPTWYADQNANHVTDLIQNLKQAKEESYTKPIFLDIRYRKKGYSHALEAFASNECRRTAYNQAYQNHDGQTCLQLLLDFVKEERPWKYKEYPCLQDEWTDKIRNAEPPAFAKIRKLDRASELETLYEHLLEPQTMNTDNHFEYE